MWVYYEYLSIDLLNKDILMEDLYTAKYWNYRWRLI